MPKLFDYLSHHKFLADCYEEKKAENPFFSLRVMARKLDGDASYLYRVMQGKAHLTPRYLEPLYNWLELNAKQRTYFELLVQFNKARQESAQRALFQELMGFRRYPSVRINADQYAYFSKWYHSAIRTLLGITKLKEKDLGKISSLLQPEVARKDVVDSVNLLKKLKLIEVDPFGYLVPTLLHITTDEALRSLAVRTYQRENMQLGMEALEKHKPELRDMSSLTVALDDSALEDIKDITREYRRQVLLRVESVEHAKIVYQFNIQIFPMTKILEGE